MPQLNSTAVLCSKIQQLKLQSRNPTQHLHYCDPETEKKLPTVVKDNIADLEGVLNQRPVTVSGVTVITSPHYCIYSVGGEHTQAHQSLL